MSARMSLEVMCGAIMFFGMIGDVCGAGDEIPPEHQALASRKWFGDAPVSDLRIPLKGTSQIIDLMMLVRNSDQRWIALSGGAVLYKVGIWDPNFYYTWKGMVIVGDRTLYLEDDEQVAAYLAEWVKEKNDPDLLDVVSVAEAFAFLRGYELMKALPSGRPWLQHRPTVITRKEAVWEVECDYYSVEGWVRRRCVLTISAGRVGITAGEKEDRAPFR